MTESDWGSSTDPTAMLAFLRDGGASERKLRLFAVACCRRVWDRLPDPRSQQAVETAERFADGTASAEEMGVTRRSAEEARREAGLEGRWPSAEWAVLALAHAPDWLPDRWPCVVSVTTQSRAAAGHRAQLVGRNRRERKRNYIRGGEAEAAAQAALLRDIFGNPFTPVPFDPSWRTSSGVSLAQQMYTSRDFALMPVLADALQDAGCDDAAILDHCRGQGPHVKGCWAMDLVLGKD
jgi:hypothetical protein